ncbi:hypothetical protein [Erythrobacter sp. MTPC3]|uniref:hypothetical protein n=1 Tax=Erythrobacter sp. MTPC3 TaxID=3056564 RepID=UPI0036F3B1BE
MFITRISRTRFAAAALLFCPVLGACTSAYTGPVEVTRFVAENPLGLGSGMIVLEFPEEMSSANAQAAFATAVGAELERLGYTLSDGAAAVSQTATIRTQRTAIEGSGSDSPVTVGGGASTGTFGSGVGLGVGINLGGGRNGPEITSQLEVRIRAADGETLWEGRAQLPTSIKSPYSELDASARTLAAALFQDFPGGNGETVQVSVDEIERTP